MSWSRRPADKPEGFDAGTDPLADNLRFSQGRRADSPTQPIDGDSIFDQHTVVDNNYANRGRARRLRQGAPFNPQQLGAWAADPDNNRKLLIVGGIAVSVLLLLVLFWVYNRTSATDETQLFSSPAPSAFASAGPIEGTDGTGVTDPNAQLSSQPVTNIPNTDPAQQPGGGFFAVTNTGTEGLFLRSAPGADPPLATLPEGTRVEWTGEQQNDGTRNWYRVRSDLGEGWVASDFLAPTQ